MKYMTTKFYALACVLALSSINAQSKKIFHTSNAPQKSSFSHKTSSSPIFEQAPEPVWFMNTPSIIDEMDNVFLPIDDLRFTTNVGLTKVETLGNVWLANDLTQTVSAVRVMIYEDKDGKPNGKPSSSANSIFYKDIAITDPAITILQSDEFIDSLLSIDLVAANNNSTVNLEANKTYWIAIALKQNLDGKYVESEKAWTRTSSSEYYNDSYVIDENNVLGMGLNDWTPVNTVYEMLAGEPHPYPEKINGQNIIVYGDNIMGTTEVFSTANVNIFPNPATDVISFKNADKVSKTEIYNTAGQIVISTTDKEINVRKLAKGTYIVKQILTDGSAASSKFIKK